MSGSWWTVCARAWDCDGNFVEEVVWVWAMVAHVEESEERHRAEGGTVLFDRPFDRLWKKKGKYTECRLINY